MDQSQSANPRLTFPNTWMDKLEMSSINTIFNIKGENEITFTLLFCKISQCLDSLRET